MNAAAQGHAAAEEADAHRERAQWAKAARKHHEAADFFELASMQTKDKNVVRFMTE